MCTVMQKDVLIEVVAQAQAIVTKRVDVNAPLTPDELRLGEIREFLYSNDPNDISYSVILDEVKTIQGKFESKPIMPQYR